MRSGVGHDGLSMPAGGAPAVSLVGRLVQQFGGTTDDWLVTSDAIYVRRYALDCAALDAEDWTTNTDGVETNKTVDGNTWTTNIHSGCNAFGPDGVAGIQVGNSSSGGSRFHVPVTTLWSDYDQRRHSLLILTSWALSVSSGYQANVQVLPASEAAVSGGEDLLASQIAVVGAEHGLRSYSKDGSTRVDSAVVPTSGSAPVTARLQTEIGPGWALTAGDVGAGSSVPNPDTLTDRTEATRLDQSAGAVGLTAVTAPTLRCVINPETGLITLTGLELWTPWRFS